MYDIFYDRHAQLVPHNNNITFPKLNALLSCVIVYNFLKSI